MDPITAGMAGGAASAFGAYMNYKSQQQTNEQNAQLAREQMGFQERMRNTAHQAEVKDLYAAGLNPILSATGGSGAATPSGSSATMVSPRMGDMLSDSVNTGLSAANLRSDLDIKNAQVAKTLAETANTLETNQAIKEDVRGRRASNARSEGTLQNDLAISDQQALQSVEKTLQSRQDTNQSRLETQRQQYDLPRFQQSSDVQREFQKVDKVIDSLTNGISAATSALNVSNYLRSPVIQSGTRRETRALERAGAKGLRVK